MRGIPDGDPDVLAQAEKDITGYDLAMMPVPQAQKVVRLKKCVQDLISWEQNRTKGLGE